MSRAANKRHLAHSSEASLPSVVIDRRGMPVDISGDRWSLNEPTAKLSLNWALHAITNRDLRVCFKRYFAWLVTTQSPMSVCNAFKFVTVLTRTSAFKEADEKAGEIPYLAFSEARASLSKQQQWQLIENDMSVEQRGGSAVIRIDAEPLSIPAGCEAQREKVINHLAAARRLSAFFADNRPLLSAVPHN